MPFVEIDFTEFWANQVTTNNLYQRLQYFQFRNIRRKLYMYLGKENLYRPTPFKFVIRDCAVYHE